MEYERPYKKKTGKVVVRFTFPSAKEWRKHADTLHRAAADMDATICVGEA